MAAGAPARRKLNWSNSITNQTRARLRKIQASGKRCSPPVRKTKAPIMSMTMSRSMRKAPKRRCFCENDANASTAQRARTRWRSGSQRKLQRKTPAVGSIARVNRTRSRASSQRLLFNKARPFEKNPDDNASDGKRLEPSSATPCRTNREEQVDQFNLHDSRVK